MRSLRISEKKRTSHIPILTEAKAEYAKLQ